MRGLGKRVFQGVMAGVLACTALASAQTVTKQQGVDGYAGCTSAEVRDPAMSGAKDGGPNGQHFTASVGN